VVAALLGATGCHGKLTLGPPQGYADFGFHGGEGRQVRVLPFDDQRVRGECELLVQRAARRDRSKPQPATPRAGLDVLCSDDPPHWFQERLAAGLRSASFEVLRDGDAGADHVLEVRGALMRLDVEHFPMMQSDIFESDVQIVLTVSSASGLRASRSFFVKASRSKIIGGRGTMQQILDEATMRSVRDMTAAVLSLVNRYPALGAADREPQEGG
jgi:hypothetical protein